MARLTKKKDEEREEMSPRGSPRIATGASSSRAVRITISGPPGSGKSTVAGLLRDRLGFEVVSAGDIFRGMAKENKMTLEEFSHLAEKSWDIDIELDKRMLATINDSGSGIFEGRMTGYICYLNDIEALKIHISAPTNIRQRRVMKRESKDHDTVLKEMREREASERKRYNSIYGYDLGDLAIYDLVIDSSTQKPAEIAASILAKLE
ncbi:MAG TPA: cytidylate kinase family protein [Thermoplasmata archaeon]|nr:cytidylate kinase family protein [Thermoplasmata archaeon]